METERRARRGSGPRTRYIRWNVGLPESVPTSFAGGAATWSGDDLAGAKACLFPKLGVLAACGESTDRRRFYAAYMYEDDDELLVVQWTQGPTAAACARTIAEAELGRDILAWKRTIPGGTCR